VVAAVRSTVGVLKATLISSMRWPGFAWTCALTSSAVFETT